MLVKIWFSTVSFILAIGLLKIIYDFDFSFFKIISLMILMFAITLTILIYLEQPQTIEIRKLENTYKDFLARKDKQIEELQQKSTLLFKTATKRSEHELELAELKRKMEEKKSQ